MKKTLLHIVFCFIAIGVFAQNNPDTGRVMMQGSYIQVNPGTQLYFNTSVSNRRNPFQFDAFPNGDINNQDTIYIAVDISNEINTPLFTTGGDVVLRYNFQQFLRNDTVNFERLWMRKPNQLFTLEHNFSVSDRIIFESGSIDLVDYNIDLGNSGILENEDFNKRVYGDKGYVIARNRLINPSNTGDRSSLGFELSPTQDNLGLTQFYRRNDIQDSSAEGSIERFFDVIPTNTANADIVFNYYDLELQSFQEKKNLRLFASPDVLVDEARNFVKYIETISDGATNKVSGTNLQLLNTGNRWTLADTNCSNPPEANLASAPIRFCKGDSVTLDGGTEAWKYVWFPTQDTNRFITIKETDLPTGVDTISVVLVAKNGCANTEQVILELYDNPVADFKLRPSYCENEEVIHENQSSIPSGTSLTYSWFLGDSSSSTDVNPQIIARFGQGTATLIATSPFGCSDTVSKNYLVSPFPTASFTPDKNDVCPNEHINFLNTSSIVDGAIAISQWTFGDGFTSTLSGTDAVLDEVKAYSSEGVYTIELKTTSNAGCVDSASTTISVKPEPMADFSFSGFTANQPVFFTNNSSISDNSGLSYNWSFETASPSIQTNPNRTFSSVGDFDVTLVATSVLNCKDSITKTVVISGVPVASATYTTSDSCSGQTIQFVNNSTVAGSDSLRYEWQFGDGSTSTDFAPSHVYLNAGNYTVRLKAISVLTGLFNQTTFPVTIYDYPEASFIGNNVCEGDTTVFINQSNLNAASGTYHWSVPGMLDTSATEFSKVFPDFGSYDVQLVATTAFGCSDTTVETVEVYPQPQAQFGLQNICAGETVFFIDSSVIDTGNLNYLWNLGDGTVSTFKNPSKAYNTFGNYEVVLQVTSDFNCTAILKDTVEVYPIPMVDFDFSLACLGDTTSFTNLSTVQNDSLWYNWNFIQSSSTLENPSVVFSSANLFSVQLTATSSKSCSSSNTQLVQVFEKPIASFTVDTACVGNPMQFSNSSFIQGNGNLSYQWNFGDGVTKFSQNPTHIYQDDSAYVVSLQVESTEGCTAQTTDTISAKGFPTADFSWVGSCLNDSLQFQATSTFSQGSLTHSWNFNDGSIALGTTPKKQFNFAKTHFVSLTSTTTFGCENTVTRGVLVNPIPVIDVQVDDSLCLEELLTIANNTSISSGTFTSTWTGGITDLEPVFQFNQGSSASLKYVAVSDQNCADSATYNIVLKSLPVANFSTQSAAFGDTTRFINLSTHQGFGLNSSWNFGNGSSSTDENPSVVYASSATFPVSLTVTSENGCSDDTVQNIFIDGPKFANFNAPTEACVNEAITIVNATQLFGSTTINYSWDFGNGNTSTLKDPLFSYADSGNYQISLRAISNFGDTVFAQKSIRINQLPEIEVSRDSLCSNQAEAIQIVNPEVQTIYNWTVQNTTFSGDSIAVNLSSSGQIPFSVLATNQFGCTDSISSFITSLPKPQGPLSDSLFPCGNDFTLMVDPLFTVLNWNQGTSTTNEILLTNDGLISFNGEDGNGCLFTDSTYVLFGQELMLDLGADSTYCEGFVLDAGASASRYLWNDGDSVRQKTITQSGTYVVSISQGDLCEASDSITVTLVNNPTLTLGNDTALCVGDSLQIGDTQSGLNYLWNTGDTTAFISTGTSGQYVLTITDANGCEATDEQFVTFNSNPTLNLGVDRNVCASEFPLTLQSQSNANSFQWSTTETTPTIQLNSGGVFSVTATNANGCSVIDSVTIISVTNPVVSLSSVTICQDSVHVLDAQNVGSVYSWSTGDTSQSINVSTVGVFSVTVTDSLGCFGTGNASVSVLQNPNSTLVDTLSRCQNQLPISLNAGNSALTYAWNTGASSNVIQANSSGIFTVTITGANGCQTIDSTFLQVYANPVVNLGNDTSLCAGNSTVFDAGVPNASYLWSNGSTSKTLVVSSTGVYSVQVTDSNNCSGSDTRNLTVFTNPVLNLGPNQNLCLGQSVQLTAGVHQSYLWSTGATTSSILANSTAAYSVEVSNANGCISTDTVLVTFNPSPTISLGPDISACGQAAVSLFNPNLSYTWSTGATTSSININTTGVYSVLASNSFGCADRDTISVTIFPLPDAELGNDTAICDGESIAFGKVIPGATYLWNTNQTSPTINVSNSGSYSWLVSSANNCIARDTIELVVDPTPAPNLGADRAICVGDDAIFSSSSTNTKLWSTGATSNSIATQNQGTYWLQETNSFGCVGSDTAEVQVFSFPAVDLANDTTVCGRITLSVPDSGFTINWSTGSSNPSILVQNSSTVNVSVANSIGCTSFDTVSITILPVPALTLAPTISTCGNDSVELNAGGNAPFYLWSTGETSRAITVSDSGRFFVTAENSLGCQTIDSVLVDLLDFPKVDLQNSYVLCLNEQVTIGSSNLGASSAWFDSTGAQFSAQDSVTFDTDGLYWLTVSNASNCSVTDTFRIEKTNNAVFADFIVLTSAFVGDSLQFINLSGPEPINSFWSFGDGIISVETDPIHVYLLAGNLTATLTVSNDACSNSLSKTITTNFKSQPIIKEPIIDQKEPEYILSAKIYPNPNNGQFTLETELLTEMDMYVDLIDIQGKRYDFQQFSGQEKYHQLLNYRGLAPGIYLMRVVANNQVKALRIVIQ